jgi:hypothetical protein
LGRRKFVSLQLRDLRAARRTEERGLLLSETTAYLPVICAAMKLMVACRAYDEKWDQRWRVGDDEFPPLPKSIETALVEMEEVVAQVESARRGRGILAPLAPGRDLAAELIADRRDP